MPCLYCGKQLWFFNEFTDGDFCSRSHRKQYHDRLKRVLGTLGAADEARVAEPKPAPQPAPAFAPPAGFAPALVLRGDSPHRPVRRESIITHAPALGCMSLLPSPPRY